MDMIENSKYVLVLCVISLICIRKCPDELKESVCSVIFSAPYLAKEAKFGEPELMKVRKMFYERYGKKFPNDCIEGKCINPKVIYTISRSLTY